MIRLAGVGASPGIAMGVAHFLGGRVEVQERRIFTDEVDQELRRFEDALARSCAGSSNRSPSMWATVRSTASWRPTA